MKPEERDLGRLWNLRAAAFWKEAGIYWGLAAQGGLAAFAILSFAVGSYFYMKALSSIPEHYPYWRISTPILTLVLAWSPIRTFLREPDTVFLMPAESRLDSYWRRCMRYSYTLQGIGTTAALLALWPLYLKVEAASASAFPVVLLLLLTAKRVALESRRHENRLADRSHRVLAGLMRWTGAVVFAFTALTQSVVINAAVLVLFILASACTIRLLPRHRINWDLEIRQEQERLLAHYTFFSWFADVPKLPSKPRPRMALARLTDLLPFDKTRTYYYLYTKTFVRSEWFAIIRRSVLVGIFLIAVNGAGAAVIGWLIYGTALAMAAATVSGLDQAHRYTFWLELYPVSKSLRVQALVGTALWALITANTILGAALLVIQRNASAWGVVAAGYGFAFFYSQVLLRKRASKEE